MKTQWISILLIFSFSFTITCKESSNDKLYLTAYEKNILVGPNGELNYLLVIKSKDTNFSADTYKFDLSKQIDFNQYAKFDNIGTIVNADEFKVKSIEDLSVLAPCVLHNKFSSYKKIYLSFKINKKSYKIVEASYLGTQKNLYKLE